MKFKHKTDEVKFKYLSSKALGTASIDNSTYFETEITDLGHEYWQGNIKGYYLKQVNKAKAIDLSLTNGQCEVFIDDDILDCSNILTKEFAFSNHYLDKTSKFCHKNRIVKNFRINGNHNFYDNSFIEEVYCNPNWVLNNYKQTQQAFSNCANLRIVKGLNYGGITDNHQTQFVSCPKLEVIEVFNINANLTISNCPNINYESLIGLLNNLVPTTSTKTLTLGSDLLAKLTDEDKKIATDKGWTLA